MINMSTDVRANYATAHAVKAILLLREKSLGREKLTKALLLNESSVRTMLRRLEKDGFVRSTENGHTLTPKGMTLHSSLRKSIEGPLRMDKTNITLSKFNVAYLIRTRARKIRKGIEQRDQAILMGADGLTTLVFDGELHVAGTAMKVPDNMQTSFSFKKGDVLLIGSAKDENKADLAALNAAIMLL